MNLFLRMIAFDGFFTAMYYLWQVMGIEQAGWVFMFMIWFCGVLGSLAILAKPSDIEKKPKIAGHDWISGAFSFAFLAGAIWAGQFVAATFYCFALLVCRSHEIRRKEQAAKGESS